MRWLLGQQGLRPQRAALCVRGGLGWRALRWAAAAVPEAPRRAWPPPSG